MSSASEDSFQRSSWSARAKEVPVGMLLLMGILAALCVVIGVYPDPFVSFSNSAAKAVLDFTQYIGAVVK